MNDPGQMIGSYSREGARIREKFFSQNSQLLNDASFTTALALASGHKLLICGNGGSAGDAQHIAGEFVNRFLIDRPALPAIALTTDTSILTAVGNDASFEQIFARQIEALGQPGDILLAISTSGNSRNIINAIKAAQAKEMQIIGLTGQAGGAMANLCNFLLAVPSQSTPLIQETHLAAEHLFCQLCDYYLFENPEKISIMLTTTN